MEFYLFFSTNKMIDPKTVKDTIDVHDLADKIQH